MRKYSENIMKIVFLTAACVSIIAVILICVFLFASGVPAIKEIGVSDFLLGDSWKPNQDLYGVFPMIIGSVYVTAGAILIGVPIGLLCAVFMARYCPKGLYKVLKPAVDLLAGIPSIVYGFFGLMVIVPLVQGSARRQWKMSSDRIGSSGDHDPANDHKCIGIEHSCGSGILL